MFAICFVCVLLSGCSKEKTADLPNNFNNLSNDQKMEYLMDKLPPDSVAVFVCDVAMGKVYDSRIELGEAMTYAYTHYDQDQVVAFDDAMANYQSKLPLHEQVKFTKLSDLIDPEMYSYELGLKYVGVIREEELDVKQAKEQVDLLMKECKSDPDFYKRFIKGFKAALNNDRGRDLDNNIYTLFISYPDSLK